MLVGSRALLRPATRPARASRLAATQKKVNTFDEDWSKGFWGTGLFVEDTERSGNYLKSLERKRVLSGVEKLGLLSKAEAAGLTLSKVESLGLLSTAEKFGLLSLAEKALTSEPGAITSLSIPFLLAALGSIIFIPDDNAALVALQYTLAAIFAGGFATFFFGGFIIKGLQEE